MSKGCSNSQRLIVLDFAGTLSLRTVLFGRKDRLERALRRSGLARLGFGDPAVFWEELVFPTWEEGGLTSKGYAGVLARRMEELIGQGAGQEETKRISQRSVHPSLDSITRRFVHLYFQHSSIDPGWKTLFQRTLHGRKPGISSSPISTPQDIFLIATDHYAECTPFLRRFLHRWGIPSESITRIVQHSRPIIGQTNHKARASMDNLPCPAWNIPVVFIANSADLGAWKKDPSFWAQVNQKLPFQAFQRLLLIDDFGFNEHQGDPYADRKRVEQRRDSILRCLQSHGASRIDIFPFFLESSVTDTPLVALYEEYGRLRGQAFRFLQDHP